MDATIFINILNNLLDKAGSKPVLVNVSEDGEGVVLWIEDGSEEGASVTEINFQSETVVYEVSA